MLQVFLNVAVFGLLPQAAIEMPRFATYSYPGPSSRALTYPTSCALNASSPTRWAARSRTGATKS
jgi:hypothetical protein